MKRKELDELAKHVAIARQKGQEAADAVDDGGTANLDSVTLHVPGTREKSLIDAGIDGYRLRSYWALRGMRYGQGAKQTAGARAACAYLQEQGYDASVWYQMD